MKVLRLFLTAVLLATFAGAATQYIDGNADQFGTLSGPFNISGSNDQLSFKIDGGGTQTFTLTHGASITTAMVCCTVNATITGGACTVSRGFVRMRTTSANGASSSVQILAPSNNANSTLGLTAGTQYGCGPVGTCQKYVYTQIAGTTKAGLIGNIESTIADGSTPVGWSVVSGGGTTNLLLMSGVTPGNQCLVARFKDNSGTSVEGDIGNCQLTLEGTSSTSAGCVLHVGAGKVYNIWANKYAIALWTPHPSSYGEFCFISTMILPSWAVSPSQLVTDSGFMDSNVESEASTTLRYSLRTSFLTCGTNQSANITALINGVLWQSNGSASNCNSASSGAPMLLQFGCTGTWNGTDYFECGYKWRDGRAQLVDAVIAYGDTFASPGLLIGQLPAAFVTGDQVPGDTTRCSSDGANVVALTDNNDGHGGSGNAALVGVRGTLWLAYSDPSTCTP